MASIYLDVPFVTQLGFGAGGLQNDPTGCWYSSACMVSYYFEAGPRLGDPTLWRDGGHDVISDSTNLLANEKLVILPYPASKSWTIGELERLLRKWGPLLLSWTKTHGGNTYGHCSTLIGVDGKMDQVIFHDPENAPNSRLSIDTFNSLFMWGIPDSLLRKDYPAHTPKTVADTGRSQFLDALPVPASVRRALWKKFGNGSK